MCGIAGVYSTSPGKPEYLPENVYNMVYAQSHRGPDSRGVWHDPLGRVVLGHSRLAIIDLSAEGHQPMLSGCGRYAISFNGEIYNFLELRATLEGQGVRFRGNSDTEVLLEAVSCWGIEKTLKRSVGMFAFAIWDESEKKLILARDRAGEKPLYYLEDNGAVYFGSELKAFKGLGITGLPLDYDSIYQYLTFGYVPAPATIYKNVREVRAGHYLVIDRRLHMESKPYWNPVWEIERPVSFAQALEEIDRLLSEAVRIRLRADVPVGCFLSGGIDSGLLTAMASLQLNHPLKTFNVSFADGAFDEGPLARLVAERYGTEHYTLTLSPNLEDTLPKVVAAYAEPFADASAVPSYCIAQEARKYVKVVLNGEGSDELFGGYRRYLAVKLFGQFEGVFGLIPDAGWRAFYHALPQPRSFRSKYAFLHRFIRGMGNQPFRRYIAWCVDGFTEEEKRRLYKQAGGYRSSLEVLAERYGPKAYRHPLKHFQAMDFQFNMHDDMLVKMDIATMAHGLEARCPYLDHRLVEWAISLPPQVKARGFTTKPLLRALARKYLPAEIVSAPKRGFEIPLIRWLKKDLFPLAHEMLLKRNGIVAELFDKRYVQDLLFGKLNIDPDRWSKRVWILLILALWDETNGRK